MASVRALLHLRRGEGPRVGAERVALLEAIAAEGSISAAAKSAGLSYKGAWDAVQALNNLFERPLVVAQPGGRSGGAAEVTAEGHALIQGFKRVEAELEQLAGRLDRTLGDGPGIDELMAGLGMRTSARNVLRGVVEKVVPGAVNAEVVLKVSEVVRIVAVITAESVRELGLEPGRPALALIKSSFVILAAGDQPLKTSARNAIPGVVLSRQDGAVNDEVTLDIGGGKTLVATITRESAEELGLQVGCKAQALIKASHVILAVE